MPIRVGAKATVDPKIRELRNTPVYVPVGLLDRLTMLGTSVEILDMVSDGNGGRTCRVRTLEHELPPAETDIPLAFLIKAPAGPAALAW